MNIHIAITNMMAFSIKVALVIGNFRAVPKHAHRILFLSTSTLITPTVVIPKTRIVTPKAMLILKRIKNRSPNPTSIKGYTKPYVGNTFAKGSYIRKDSGKPFRSRSLKKLNTT